MSTELSDNIRELNEAVDAFLKSEFFRDYTIWRDGWIQRNSGIATQQRDSGESWGVYS